MLSKLLSELFLMLIFISLHLIAHFFSYYHHYTLDQHLATSRPYLLLHCSLCSLCYHINLLCHLAK